MIVLIGALAAGANASKNQQAACANIERYNLEKQMNAHAAQILASCGRSKTGSQAHSTNFTSLGALAPATYGGPDVNMITGPPSGEGTFPHVTQSETFTWAQGNTVVTTINDSRTAPSCYSGGSYSLDNGATFVPLNARPFCSGHGTGYGDPVSFYDQAHAKWVAVFLASGCGGQGMGVWFSVDGITWTVGPCAHSGGGDDRESGWVDNNPSSPYYGRMYLSWNNFNVGGGALQVISSSDGGTTWTSPVTVNAGFIRNVQITTGPDGAVFIAAMNEGGGGLGSRTNTIYRSTNGGTTWSSSNTGASFPGPGQSTCGYFAAMFPSYWRHMGWGDIGAGPGGIIHYAYAQHGAGSDYGDVYYVRSPDNGSTWSTPLKMNTDGGARSQWQPSLSVSPGGNVLVSWYDARNTTGNSFERFARLSPDNGATWGNDEVMSDAPSPLPLQPDGSVQACYTGDYDRSYSNATAHYTAWVDGRVSISGTAQQDVVFDKHPVGPPPPPAPNLVHDLTTLFDGNSNGYIDPGESFGLDERVRNAGNADAHSISGVLTSPTPGITITTGNSAYPDIPAGGHGHEHDPLPGQRLRLDRLRRGGQLPSRADGDRGHLQRQLHRAHGSLPELHDHDPDRTDDRPRHSRHRQPLRRLHDCDHLPLPGLRLRPLLHLGRRRVERDDPVRRRDERLYEHLPERRRLRADVLPLLGRPVHAELRLRHLHGDHRLGPEPHLLHRVAGAVLPGLGQRQLRGRLQRERPGPEDDLRDDDQCRQLLDRGRAGLGDGPLCPVRLRWSRRRDLVRARGDLHAGR